MGLPRCTAAAPWQGTVFLMPERCTAVLFVPSSPEHWRHSVHQLVRSTDIDIVVGVLYPSDGAVFDGIDDRVEWYTVGSISELINRTYRTIGGHILVVNDALSLPLDMLDTAQRWVRQELRVATISFLSNASDSLSFPIRNQPQTRLPDGHDEQTITDRLRSTRPEAQPAPIPIAHGSLVLISAWALGAVGELQAPASARFDIAVADFSARAAEKGFVNIVDTSTVIARPADIAVQPADDHLSNDDMGWLLHRHRWLIGFIDSQRQSGDSAFAHAHQVARVKVTGLSVLVDGSCFGPNQTGTQVATARTIRALAEHRGVNRVFVSLPGPPASYARELLDHPKVEYRAADAESFGVVDIAFRPYQPTPGFDLPGFGRSAVRTVISMLDVIAYANGSYFESPDAWREYRTHIDDCVSRVDAITVISSDVREQMMVHGLPVDASKITVVPLGTTNISVDAPRRCPEVLERRGFAARRFAVIIGVNYHHKNRELAMAAHIELRRRAHDLDLVMAGPAVPYGSTRLRETDQRAALGGDEAWLHVLPELADDERNWLLSHASIAWYPTSAEGFGFLPFESAAFDVPSVSVGFGPLEELSAAGRQQNGGTPTVPLMATSWDASSLCDVAEAFLLDPGLALRHCAAIREAGRHYSWEAHAERLVQLFREIMARPRSRR